MLNFGKDSGLFFAETYRDISMLVVSVERYCSRLKFEVYNCDALLLFTCLRNEVRIC